MSDPIFLSDAVAILRHRREAGAEDVPSILRRSETASSISSVSATSGTAIPGSDTSKKGIGWNTAKRTAASGASLLEKGRQLTQGEAQLSFRFHDAADTSAPLGSFKIPGMQSQINLTSKHKDGTQPNTQIACECALLNYFATTILTLS